VSMTDRRPDGVLKALTQAGPGSEEVPMDLHNWSKSNLDYGRKLFDSGLEGSRSGQEEFLHGKPLGLFLDESAPCALKSAAFGAVLGLLRGLSRNGHRSAGRALAYGCLGGAIGFGAGLAWQGRRLVASAASGAARSISRARDEHWLESNPIDYA